MEKSPEFPQQVKKQSPETSQRDLRQDFLDPVLIDVCSSDSDSDSGSSSSGGDDGVPGIKRSRKINGSDGFVFKKRKKAHGSGVVLPAGFLDPLPGKEVVRPLAVVPPPVSTASVAVNGNMGALVIGKGKQFWKAGDYDSEAVGGDREKSTGGMDHVRVHPRFLHSNATSHKWVLGAFAELLDNSLDECVNGATFVNIDMIQSKKDACRMLVIEDNGGGMDPDKMRQCMSLGYSLKSKVANTIGQYGNGFKTSTMRLGADVIVFSRYAGKDGKRATQSIGLLSYTFLRSTGKEDIIVPMLDYERVGSDWNKIIRSSAADWNRNVETIVRWSPFSSEVELFRQFNQMKDQGTRIIIYNLWEDDQGQLELDFDSDMHDIQIRGVNRDDKNIQMAQQFPNSRHFLTYRHSLRSYASILYLRIPPGFRIILRGQDVEHHNIVNDMMMTQEVTYRPNPSAEGILKESNMYAVVTMGFVKDAKAHIDVQGFNVYHKNRLIKPFWRVWNAAGSDGRGVIGVLEANFVEPAHDKQGFERTIVLSRLETKLVQIQKNYWSTKCHKIGYAARRNKKLLEEDRESSPEYLPQTYSAPPKNSTNSSSKTRVLGSGKYSSHKTWKHGVKEAEIFPNAAGGGKYEKEQGYLELISASAEDIRADNMENGTPKRRANGSFQKNISSEKSFRNGGSTRALSPSNWEHSDSEQISSLYGRSVQSNRPLHSKGDDINGNGYSPSNDTSSILNQLKEENHELKNRLKEKEEEISANMSDLQSERKRCSSLEARASIAKLLYALQEATKKIEDMNKEQESLIDIFSEERERRDIEEENLRKKVKEASNTIQELVNKVRLLEKKSSFLNRRQK